MTAWTIAQFPQLKPGVIFGELGSGPLGKASERLITPHTNRYHHGILGDYIPWEDDFEIFESISKGPSVGRLSWYCQDDLEFYWPAGATDLDGQLAAAEATRYGRAGYDYDLFLQMSVIHNSRSVRGDTTKRRL